MRVTFDEYIKRFDDESGTDTQISSQESSYLDSENNSYAKSSAIPYGAHSVIPASQSAILENLPKKKTKFVPIALVLTAIALIVVACLSSTFFLPEDATAKTSYTDVALGTPAASDANKKYVELLDDEDKKQYEAYIDIMDKCGKTGVKGTDGSDGWANGDFDVERVKPKVLSYACYDNPIYSLYRTGCDDGIGISYNFATKGIRIYSPAVEAGDDFAEMYKQVRQEAEEIRLEAMEQAKGSSAEYARQVMRRVATNCQAESDRSGIHSNDIYGCLVEKKSRCFGFASAVKYLLDEENIANFIATGESNGVRHAWNMVNIGGSWLILDATYTRSLMDSRKTDNLETIFNADKYCLKTFDELSGIYNPEDETKNFLGIDVD